MYLHVHVHIHIHVHVHVCTCIYQGINEGDFYTFEGLFQLEQEGSRRCNTMNVLTLYLYKCLSNGRPLNSEEIQYILVLKGHTLVHSLFTLSHYQSPCDKCNN